MQKERIIFIYPKLFTFIKTERKLLSTDYEIISINQNWTNKFLLPLNLLHQLIFLLFNVKKVNTILVSFGGYWSFLPALFGKIFNKKVAIVVHGTDCVSFPEINYGNLSKPLMRWFTKKSYQLASIILPVSKSLVYTENNYYCDRTLKFGYSFHLDNINTPYKIIPNGLIIKDWNRNANIIRDKKSFITVLSEGKIILKGVDLIIEVASKFPNHNFYLAGIDNLETFKNVENIYCLGKLTPKELNLWYSKTQFYLQLSNTEGFGVAICEAMLCNCIPIVSDVNHLPTIIGDSGFVLMKRNSNMLVDLINVALKSDISDLEQKARKRIVNNFSVENRQRLLIKELFSEEK
jgi:glycosyltransferase involved in cell wall biosynthesis